jgi:hypothetical protein
VETGVLPNTSRAVAIGTAAGLVDPKTEVAAVLVVLELGYRELEPVTECS